MAARIGAVVAAIAMIVVAVVVRDRIDEKKTTTRLTCSTELAQACSHLGSGTDVLNAVSAAIFAGRSFVVADDALRKALRNMRSCQGQSGTEAVTTLLTSGGAQLDLVFTTEATAQSVLASAANKNVAAVLYP